MSSFLFSYTSGVWVILLILLRFVDYSWITYCLILYLFGQHLYYALYRQASMQAQDWNGFFSERTSIRGGLNNIRQLLMLAKSCSVGWFAYFHGPMFAEKTTAVISICRHFRLGGHSVVAIKYTQDNRESPKSELCSHDESTFPAIMACTFAEADDAIKKAGLDPTIIAFDEGQFFKDAPIWVEKWVAEGRLVIGAGLLSDRDRKVWPVSMDLLEMANTQIQMTSICRCGRPATLTALIKGTQEAQEASSTRSNSPTLEIGGKDRYVPCCVNCHPVKHALKSC
eukprot:TRINITY_DN7684_c0_g1_i1.p1 TRINITY_DN7684_c0_g1~~TRINITY_DN7684_c0_g1_i1.p1  ORF type:complete len:283 (-),score=57.89 TRINITY_DN7684_c0_g1_i1:480-1328(-)